MELLCLNNVLPDVELPLFQRQGMYEVFTNKRMLLAFDTGTGKTFTYAGIVRGLVNKNPEGKHILVIINESMSQVPEDVRVLTGSRVEAFDGTEASVGHLRFWWKRCSVFCLTYEAFRQPEIVEFLFSVLPEIDSFVIDEAHHCSNFDVSDTAFMIRSFVQWIPYAVALTATPITRESKQYFRLMNLLDRNISMHRDERFRGSYIERYMAVNRDDYDIKGTYTTTLVKVTPTLDQIQPQHGIVFRKLKGTGAVNQAKALVDVVRTRLEQDKTIIVYVHYHDSRQWIESHLREAGIPFTSVHGRITKKADRQTALQRFMTGEVRVIITSVTESLNIEADVVVFYEFTTLVKQVMGRAHRGLNPKDLELVFLITENSDEVDYFLKYIYKRSITIQRLLGKDYSELIALGREVKKLEL